MEQLQNLTINYLPPSFGAVEDPAPVMRWVIPAVGSKKGCVQTAYRLRVAGWDSGEVTTNSSAVVYSGHALVPDREYNWSVSVKLSDGRQLNGSSSFATGVKVGDDGTWNDAQWIAGTKSAKYPRRNNLRTEWVLDDSPDSATAFLAGVGYHEFYCNGQKQGDLNAKLQPGYTNYEKRTYYVRYSLSDCLKKGTNVLGISLGNGWFSQGAPHGQPGNSIMPGSRAVPPMLLFRARATVGGKDVVLVSQASGATTWVAADGPIVEDSLYNGEIYDARVVARMGTRRGGSRAPTGAEEKGERDAAAVHFSDPDFEMNASAWEPVIATHSMPKTTKVVSQNLPPIRKLRRLPAQKITHPAPGIYTIDFGQNTAGIVRMRIPKGMQKGENITIYHGEALNHPPYTIDNDGRVYTGNLRKALARDVYISSGEELEGQEWEPTFTQHGFRYIEVHGLQSAPRLGDFTCFEMHTAVVETGAFRSSSALLNSIHTACAWTARSNLMSLPTDCCQRNERRGWMGDAALGASVNVYLHDMSSFYASFAQLMSDDQGRREDGDGEGAMPDWVPVFHKMLGSDFPGAGAPNWQTAFPTILHTLWAHTGDDALVRQHWPALSSYLQWYERKLKKFPQFSQNPFQRDSLGHISATQPPGDWCPPPKVPGSFWNEKLNHSNYSRGLGEAECGSISSIAPASLFTNKLLAGAFAYLNDRKNVATMGAAVGESVPGITDALKQNFVASFYNSTAGYFGSGGDASQSEQILPLLLDLAPSDVDNQKVIQFLLHDITDRHSNHTSSGIVGLRAMFELMPQLGLADVALSILLRTDYPSFGYQIMNSIEPATTIWEVFDAWAEGPSMDSRNHVMFATPSYFFFRSVAGVSPVEGQGDTLWRVAPAVVGASPEVTAAEASVWTVKGSLDASWSLLPQPLASGGWAIAMNVSVPIGLRVLSALPLPRLARSTTTAAAASALAAQCEVSMIQSGSRIAVWRNGSSLHQAVEGISLVEVTLGAPVPAITASLESGVFQLEMQCAA